MDIKWLKDITRSDHDLVGAKAVRLHLLQQAQASVPDAFCITAQSHRTFFSQGDLDKKILRLLKQGTQNDYQATARHIQELILATPLGTELTQQIIDNYELLSISKYTAASLVLGTQSPVAIRSSPLVVQEKSDFIGQQATFVNMQGEAQVLGAIRACWASCFTAAALHYRQKHKLRQHVIVPLLVQKMIPVEKSGIFYNHNPVTANEQEFVIEAAHGIARALSLAPNTYIIDRHTKKVKEAILEQQETGTYYDQRTESTQDTSTKSKQIISDLQVGDLCRLGAGISEKLGSLQAIEWVCVGNQVFILDSRPCLPLRKQEKKEDRKRGAILLRGQIAAAGTHTGIVHHDPSNMEPGSILVLSNAVENVTELTQVGAIILDTGGLDSKVAKYCRSAGIPCLTGTHHASQMLLPGQLITLDASHGLIYEGNVTVPVDTRRTSLALTLDVPSMATQAASTGAQGVSLINPEKLCSGQLVGKTSDALSIYTHTLVQGLTTFSQVFAGKQLWVRGSGDFLESAVSVHDKLTAEIAAIRQLHYLGHKEIGLLLPLTTKLACNQAKALYAAHDAAHIPMGIVIETPAACLNIGELCQALPTQVTIDTTKLLHHTLGNQKLTETSHPALLAQVEKVIKSCKFHAVTTAVCGRATRDAKFVEYLIHLGVHSIGVATDVYDEMKQVINSTENKVYIKAAQSLE